jgi:hypothetical protein
MPYAIRKNSDGSYRVINTDTGDVKMEHGSKADAEAQLRLLYGVEHGMVPRRKAMRRRKK